MTDLIIAIILGSVSPWTNFTLPAASFEVPETRVQEEVATNTISTPPDISPSAPKPAAASPSAMPSAPVKQTIPSSASPQPVPPPATAIAPPATPPPTLPPPTEKPASIANAIRRSFFGMHIHNNEGNVPWPAVPVGTIRLHDTRTTWAHLEEEKGEWYWDRLDMFVNQAYAKGSEIMYTLGQTPKWAAARPSDPTMYYERTTSGSEPKNMEDWKNYIAAVAKRYKGKIKYYEVWNEPNYSPFYTGDVKTMVELTRVAKETLAEIDPNAKVVSPAATTAENGEAWLDTYLALGGGKYVDVVAFHYYVDYPEEIPALSKKLRGIVSKYGVGSKPIWDTEIGWCIENDNTGARVSLSGICPNTSDVLSAEEGVGYVARSYILSAASGVARIFWYSWDADDMGVAESNGRILKKSGSAIKTLQSWLEGNKVQNCASDGVWTCELVTSNGTHHIVWNPKGMNSFTVPASWNAKTYVRMSGGEVSIGSNGAIVVDVVPVMVK